MEKYSDSWPCLLHILKVQSNTKDTLLQKQIGRNEPPWLKLRVDVM
jgi:hypothetical protein